MFGNNAGMDVNEIVIGINCGLYDQAFHAGRKGAYFFNMGHGFPVAVNTKRTVFGDNIYYEAWVNICFGLKMGKNGMNPMLLFIGGVSYTDG